MAQGLSFESFAGDRNVCVKTLYTWTKEHKSFLHAKRVGEAKCLAWFEKVGKAGLAGKQLNTINWLFQMKCRFHKYGWNPENQNLAFQDIDEESGFEFV